MGLKYNINNVRELFKSKGLILDETKYINTQTKMICYDNEGYKYETTVNSLISNSFPLKFSKYNRFSIQNIQLMLDKDNCNTKIIENKYVNNRTKMKFICSCGKMFEADLNQLTNDGKRYCNYCAKSKRYDDNNYYQIALEKCIENDCVLLTKTIIRTHHNIEYICNKHSNKGVQSNKFSVFINKKYACKYCAIESTGELHRISQNEIKSLLEEKGFIYVNHDYLKRNEKASSKVRIHYICKKHKDKGVQYVDLANLKNNKNGCPYCIGRGRTKESLQDEFDELNNGLIITSFNSYSDIRVKCKNCDFEWDTYGVNIISGHGCPKCNRSKGEKQIEKILIDNSINHITQKWFSDCKDILPLPFDFYLCNLNILIEVDGEQHYKPICFGGISIEKARENFKITQKHDLIKNQFCKDNGIRLIRIPYFIIQDKTIDLEEYLLNKINYTH